MNRNRWTCGICVAILVLGATGLWAQTGKAPQPFSVNHTAIGVSQFLATPTTRPTSGNTVDLMNPNNIGMVAAVLLYEREGVSPGGGTSETYLGCAVVDLSQHHSEGVEGADFDPDLSAAAVGGYAEVIAAPRKPVTLPDGSQTRLADGLGITIESGRNEGPVSLLGADMFSLPTNSAVPDQRTVARDCICAGLTALAAVNPNITEDTFSQFPTVGVCPAFP